MFKSKKKSNKGIVNKDWLKVLKYLNKRKKKNLTNGIITNQVTSRL